jgi:hypothetical protein
VSLFLGYLFVARSHSDCLPSGLFRYLFRIKLPKQYKLMTAFLSPKHLNWLWDPHCLLFSGFPEVKRTGRGTDHSLLVPKSRKLPAMPPYPSLHSTYRDNIKFTLKRPFGLPNGTWWDVLMSICLYEISLRTQFCAECWNYFVWAWLMSCFTYQYKRLILNHVAGYCNSAFYLSMKKDQVQVELLIGTEVKECDLVHIECEVQYW